MSTSFSSSSSRTIYPRDVSKLPVKDESVESILNLDHLEIPDETSIQSLRFLDDPEEQIFPDPPPLSPKTVALRREIVREAEEVGKVEFVGNPSLTYTSIYVVRPISCDSLRSWIDLDNGWKCVILSLQTLFGLFRNSECKGLCLCILSTDCVFRCILSIFPFTRH